MSAMITVAVAVIACSCVSAHASWPPMPESCTKGGTGGINCIDRPAVIPVHTAAPNLTKTVKNGKRFVGGSGNDTFHVAHLYSETDDLYEMGFALGQLFPEEINDMWGTISPWLATMLENAVPWLPKWLAELVIKDGAPVAIEVFYDIMQKYMPKETVREWEGIAAGANVSITKVRFVSLFPQLSKAACTILLANKKATLGGGVHHLRALDFDPHSHVADFSSVVVYHYKSKPALANLGWIAMTGVLTGMNSVPMSVGEKAWGGHTLLIPTGLPWMQMVRQSLELGSIAEVNAFLLSHSRAASPEYNSVSIHLGYGDQATNRIKGYEVGYNYSKSFEWNTLKHGPRTPQLEDVTYWCKNSNPKTMCPAEMLTAQHGTMTAEWMAMYYSPNDKTGDTQVAAFDLEGMKVWYANSRKSNVTEGSLCAYNRQRTVLDMKAIFAEPSPSV
jgi:hypothetical protein